MTPNIVLLTGGRTGIGLELARILAGEGARVYSASRQLCSGFKPAGSNGEIIPVQMDVNDERQITAVIDRILAENGKLDAVVCNAGNGIAGAVEDTSSEETRYQMETNFFGAVKTIHACLPVFRKQGFGKIMAVSSVAAIAPIPFQAFYSAGKSALFLFMQALSIEVASFGIQCCTVLPGDTKTEFTSARKYTQASQAPGSAYREKMEKAVGKMEKDEKHGMEARFVAQKMAAQLLRKRMKSTVIPGAQYKIICHLLSLLPVRIRLLVVKWVYL